MAPRTRTSTSRYHQLSALLSSAALEWVLMLLMLLEGLLSYLSTSFARLCNLQPPCPMCARLDHVLGGDRYRDLMCGAHKAEASSWAFCHVHQNLADVHGMCEACLLSFAADHKSNLETYRSLAGKLGGVAGIGHGGNVMEDGALCSCCSLPVGARSCPFVGSGIDVGVEGFSGDVSRDHRCVDEMDRAGYSELKTSDSEPELLQRAGEVGGRSAEHADIIHSLKEEFAAIHGQIETAYGNAEEKIASYSELTRVQDRVSDETNPQDPKEESNDLPRKDGQGISEESHTDKPQDDVWHNALGSAEESPATDTLSAKSSETKAGSVEPKPEFSDRSTTRQDSFVVHQDLKLLLSQLSASSRMPDTPRLQEQAVLRNITRVLSLERNYSGVSDGSMVNAEAEAEEGAECSSSTVDALRRQVELDRRSMALLWKELEEERSASAVAASQAMAMITRLQEEKAATRTEAAQYRRVMEEQSAYDREDADRLTREVRDLEAEVERCRAELRDQERAGEIRDQMRLFPPRPREEFSGGAFGDEENAYISKQLRKLTEKLHRFSNDSSRIITADLSDDEQEDDNDSAGQEREEDIAEASEVGRRVRNADNFTKWQQLQWVELTTKGGGESDNMAGLQDEVSELSGRLQALEADRSFLEHSVNSLRNGREGEAVIHDIARSLRELRNTLGNDR